MNTPTSESLKIRFAEPADKEAWRALWDGYNAFYKRSNLSETITQIAWSRFLDPNEDMFALVAELEGRVVGFTHYLFHRNTTLPDDICYLQDLFTAEPFRRHGVARTLIEAVYEKARERGAARVYWQTHESNTTARHLYDKVADFTGFVIYRKQL